MITETTHLEERPPIVRGSPMRLLRILDLVSEAYDVSQTEILGQRRFKSVARARLCAMWLARRATEMSYPQIGAALSRDHTTVMSGCVAHGRLMLRDPSVKARTEAILFEVMRKEPVRHGPGAGTEFHEVELIEFGESLQTVELVQVPAAPPEPAATLPPTFDVMACVRRFMALGGPRKAPVHETELDLLERFG